MPKKGKDPKKVLKHTTTKTLENGAYSYGVASSSSLLGSAMQNSANKVIQNLSNGSIPTMVVGVGVGSCEVLIKYFRGKINSVECLEQLGEENTKFLSGIAMGHWSISDPHSCGWGAHWGLCGCSVERSFF
ncbi:hypothetical protein ID0445_03310 [Helicobacter pylori]